MPEELSSIAQNTFDQVLHLLLTKPGFRESFSLDAEGAVRSAGIYLTSREAVAIGRLGILRKRLDKEKDTFDDRLVLCSSSGY